MKPWRPAAKTAGDLSNRNDVDNATTASNTELHGACSQCEECVIATAANMVTRVEVRSTLAHDDFTGIHQLPTKTLHTESLRI
jgi:hypothetical protein